MFYPEEAPRGPGRKTRLKATRKIQGMYMSGLRFKKENDWTKDIIDDELSELLGFEGEGRVHATVGTAQREVLLDDGGAQPFQERGHRGLARADTSREPDDRLHPGNCPTQRITAYLPQRRPATPASAR